MIVSSGLREASSGYCRHVSGVYVAFGPEEVEQSLTARFAEQVRRYPERLAVKTRDVALTYAELDAAANGIAHAILAERGAGAEPIGLLLELGAVAIAALLGVLKAGKFYVPLDPAFPAARLRFMLEDAGAALLLTNNRHRLAVRELAGAGRGWLDVEALPPQLPTANPALALTPDTLAFILYTSGSTGQPKGVYENHRNVLHEVMEHTSSLGFCADDRVALVNPLTSRASARRIFPALMNGSALCLLDLKEEGIGRVPAWLREERITMGHARQLFRQCADPLGGGGRFPDLRLLVWGGEPVYRRDVERFQALFPAPTLLAITYAATETGTVARRLVDQETRCDEDVVSVGRAPEGTEILILDEGGQPLGPNQVGEIAVRSRYLALGYWQRPDLTRERFLPDPAGGSARIYRTGDRGLLDADGCVRHLGRVDFQVRVRGHRIEIGEVERALRELETLREAVVVGRPDPLGEQQLVAYVVPVANPAPTVSVLRRELAQRLPEPMIPAAFMTLAALPRGPHGKVDRSALPPPVNTRPALETPYCAPRTPLEESLGRLWEDLLGLAPIGVHDLFGDVGGHSVLAARLLSRLSDAYQVEVPLLRFLAAPTVAGLAVAILTARGEGVAAEDLDLLLQEVEALSHPAVPRILAESAE